MTTTEERRRVLDTAARAFEDLVEDAGQQFMSADWQEIQRTLEETGPFRLGNRTAILDRPAFATLEEEAPNGTQDTWMLPLEMSRLQALHQMAALHRLRLLLRKEAGALDDSLWLVAVEAFAASADEKLPLAGRVCDFYPFDTAAVVAFCNSEGC